MLMSTTALLACGNTVSAMFYYTGPKPGPITNTQIGEAQYFRPHADYDDKQTLNSMVHVAEGTTVTYGPNPYADDFLGNARAQETLEYMDFKYNFCNGHIPGQP